MSLTAPSPTNTALVTGASSGIGAEMAKILGRRGWHVSLVARRREALEAVAKSVVEVGGKASVFTCDLSESDERSRLVSELEGAGRVIAVAINNAGFSTFDPVWNSDPSREVMMTRTNVEAVIDLCSRLIPAMVERGEGAVLNVASTAAFQPIPGQAGYAASKAFVLSYSEALAAELRGTGVSVTALCPGPVETGFGEAAGIDDDEAKGALPEIMWESAEDVAAAGIEAMSSGKRVVIPGAPNRVSAALARFAPRGVLLPVMARQHPAMKR